MKRFVITTRESRYLKYYVDGEDINNAYKSFDPNGGGKEIDYDWELVDIEELQEFTEFVLDAATQPLEPEQ